MLSLARRPIRGFTPSLGGKAQDRVEFRQLLDDEDDPLAETPAEEGNADVVVVLVAIADDQALIVVVQCQCDHQLGFRPGFESVVVVLARQQHLLDDFAQLVHLDREDPAIGTGITLFADRLGEHLVELHHPVAQEVLKPDDHRGLQSLAARLLHDVVDADRRRVRPRVHADVTLAVDAEMSGTPAVKSVEFL